MIGFPISQFLSYLISFLFPGYKSFRAVLSDTSDDDTRWLTYWVVYAFVQYIETAFSLIVATFPFYYEFKCFFLLLLQMNDAALSQRLYEQFLGPVLESFEPQLDKFIQKYSQEAVTITHSANKAAKKALIEAAIAD